MVKVSAYAAALSCLMMLAPGMVQMSAANGSAYEQRKSAEANMDYKALMTPGARTDVGAVVAPAPASAANAGGYTRPSEPLYPAPRGGREY